MDFQKRLPAPEKTISEIEPENDVRVRILGKIVDMVEDSFVVDDGEGRVQIATDPEIDMSSFHVNDNVKVIGRIFASEGGFEMRAETIQNINGMDFSLHKKVRDMEKSAG